MTTVTYRIGERCSATQFIELLRASTLAERRPVGDVDCIARMLQHTDLLVSAWDGDLLIGAARSVTDFHYACYLSDLAVHQRYQRRGIGKELIRLSQSQLGPRCKLILLAAPAAHGYYEQAGFAAHPRCWILEPGQSVI